MAYNVTSTFYVEYNILPHWSETFRNCAKAFNNLTQAIVITAAMYYVYRAMRREDAAARVGRGR